jgi:hypothetical protein
MTLTAVDHIPDFVDGDGDTPQLIPVDHQPDFGDQRSPAEGTPGQDGDATPPSPQTPQDDPLLAPGAAPNPPDRGWRDIALAALGHLVPDFTGMAQSYLGEESRLLGSGNEVGVPDMTPSELAGLALTHLAGGAPAGTLSAGVRRGVGPAAAAPDIAAPMIGKGSEAPLFDLSRLATD